MISNSTGRKILDYLNRSINENISITITAHESGQFRELSATSLAFIIVGSVAIVLIVSLMWALFYKIQKHRRIDDRELLSVIILHLTKLETKYFKSKYMKILMFKLTKKAISKMKFKKLKDGDQV